MAVLRKRALPRCVAMAILGLMALVCYPNDALAQGGEGLVWQDWQIENNCSAPPSATPPSGAYNCLEEDRDARMRDITRLLNQATFGATVEDIAHVHEFGQSQWFQDQMAIEPSLHLPGTLAFMSAYVGTDEVYTEGQYPSASWWKASIEGQDQLRQRVAFALSELLVASAPLQGQLWNQPEAVAAYMDILSRNALGNYRELLEEVTYSPMMGVYLTFVNNRRAGLREGLMPDENYAREIMQLFTIGLVELEQDGTIRLENGAPIETYDNKDVRGLASVFTGLSFASGFGGQLGQVTVEDHSQSLAMFEVFHEPGEKRFLGQTIPAGTDGVTSISMALDILMDHPNVAPFVSRQLIQRLVTSNPSPSFIARVSSAFESGHYILPEGGMVGDGRKGDLAATVAAILFDDEARTNLSLRSSDYGKLREPVIRFTHWARAFAVNNADAMNEVRLLDTSSPNLLNQHPFRAPSVFNFFRPGFVPPNTGASEADLTVPEMQIVNEASIVGYINFMSDFVRGISPKWGAGDGFSPDYSREMALADDPHALVDHLNDLLLVGQLETVTRQRMIDSIQAIPLSSVELPDARDADLLERVHTAVLMAMTAPEYLIQK